MQRAARLGLTVVPFVLLGGFLLVGPIAQPQDYHLFADRRALWGIANFNDVGSNLALAIAGAMGLYRCLAGGVSGAIVAWTVLFLGYLLVSAGSAFYHLDPRDGTLVWDRLAMAVAFAGAYVALSAEYVAPRWERILLAPALAAATGSVLWWHVAGDLGPYFAMQATVFASALVMLAAFDDTRRRRPYLASAFAVYTAAIACEQLDHEIFHLTGSAVSGHTVKHLLAALAALIVWRMLGRRGGAGAGAG